MIWIPVAIVMLVAAVAAPFALLFHPIRRLSLGPLRSREWNGRVPYRIVTVGDEEILVVRGLPYPSTFLPESPTRESTSLDGTWRFSLDPESRGLSDGWWEAPFDDSSWEPVVVPGTFNPARGEHTNYLGHAWYRRDVSLPDAAAAARLRLRFAGLLLRGRVWWNGELLGEYEGGYTPNYFDLTGRVLETNTLAVLCDNRLTSDSLPPRLMRRHNPGWHTYGGIHRSVSIERLPANEIVTVRVREVDAWLECRVVTRHANNAAPDLRASIAAFDGDGPAAEWAMASAFGGDEGEHLRAWNVRLPVTGIPRWSPDSPRRFRLTIELSDHGTLADSVSTSGGLRSIRTRGEEIVLDGRSLFLRGICKHEDHPVLGATQSPDLVRSDATLIERMHASYVRLAHYPHDEAEIEELESRGILMSEEIPLYQAGTGFAAWWEEHGRLRDFPAGLFGIRQTRRRELLANARRQLLELIERDRHRPAVVMWSTGNECYTHGRRAAAVFTGLASIARRSDPSRLTTYVEMTYYIPFFDDHRRGWTGVDVLSINSYFGWYFARPGDLQAHLERLASRWRGRPLLLSEFGAGAAPGRSAADGPWRGDRVQTERTYGEDYQAELLTTYWRIARANPWVRGFTPWVFSDFYNIWFPANPIPNYNLKGVVSADRVPKLGYTTLQKLYEETIGE